MKCYHCGKGALFGRSHTHHRGVAGGRWKKRAPKTQRIFRPNLHKVAILEAGKKLTVLLCSKCLKRVRKDMKDGVRPFLTLVNHQEKQKVILGSEATPGSGDSGQARMTTTRPTPVAA